MMIHQNYSLPSDIYSDGMADEYISRPIVWLQ